MDQQGDLGDNRAAKGGKNREVKRRCRRDGRVYVESEAERAEEAGKRGDARTLYMYEIARKVTGKFQNTCKPMRNKADMLLRSAEEEMHRWREHFQTVLNHEEPLNLPKVEPNDKLNTRTGCITRIEVKNAIMKLKMGRLQDVTIYHLKQLRWEGRHQR